MSNNLVYKFFIRGEDKPLKEAKRILHKIQIDIVFVEEKFLVVLCIEEDIRLLYRYLDNVEIILEKAMPGNIKEVTKRLHREAEVPWYDLVV